MNKLNNYFDDYLKRRFKWYKKWHEKKSSQIVHWIIFLIYVLAVFLFLQSDINVKYDLYISALTGSFSPDDNTSFYSTPRSSWPATRRVTGYNFQLSPLSDPNFLNTIISTTVSINSYNPTVQLSLGSYIWRVRAKYKSSYDSWSIAKTFSIIVSPCSSFTYSNWSDCQSNNTQTRTVITSSPTGCTGGNPEITQSCTYVPPGSCYLGMEIPSDITLFSATSPWNNKITSPAYNSNSATMIVNLQNILTNKYLNTSYKTWSVPIHVINSSFCPNVTVTASGDPFFGGYTSISLPIPVEAWVEPSTDGHMILLDLSTNKVIELSKFNKINLTAGTVTKWDLASAGYGTPFSGTSWWMQGSNGAGAPYIAGIITLQEMKNGAINHALNIITPNNRKFTDVGQTVQILCSPIATRADGKVLSGGVWSYGYSDNNFYEGSRIRLDPTVTETDFNSWGLSEHAKIIARALRDYGAFVIDNGPNLNLTFQNMDSTGSGARWINEGFSDITDIQYIPLDKLKVLTCNTVTK